MDTTTTVTCPDCGTTTRIDPSQRGASEFCPKCDYPLFWVGGRSHATDDEDGGDHALRRLPGTGGQVVVGHRVCPNCGELNPLGTRFCIRCSTDMDPPPPPEPVIVAPPPPPAPVIEPRPLPNPPWWPWAIVALLAAVALVILILR